MNILLVGKMGSGKDYIASILEEKYNYKIHKLGYYIRKHVDEIYAYLPLSERRKYYQQYGETLRENIDIDIWNNGLWNRLTPEDIEGNIVISDVRQPHEIIYWTKKGFIPIGVVVDDDIRLKRMNERDGGYDIDSLSHSTEINAENIINSILSNQLQGYIIDNNGSVEDTLQQIENIFKFNKKHKI